MTNANANVRNEGLVVHAAFTKEEANKMKALVERLGVVEAARALGVHQSSLSAALGLPREVRPSTIAVMKAAISKMK